MRLWLGLIFLMVYASPASTTVGERVLIGENKGLTVSIVQDFVCTPEMDVTVNVLDKQIFSDERAYLQSIANALPSILSAECGDSVTLETVNMWGTVRGDYIYLWTATSANNWVLDKVRGVTAISAPMPPPENQPSNPVQQVSPAPIIVSATMPKSENADGESKNVPAIGAPIIVSVPAPAPPVVETTTSQPVTIEPEPVYTPSVSQDVEEFSYNSSPYETNAVSAFAIAFINSGAMLEFGDEIYCSVLSWASGESGGIFGTQTFKNCRYHAQMKIAYIEKHHSTTALVGLLLGYILLAPAALMYYLFYAKKKNPTPKDIFKSTFKLELGEGAVCVVGQVMTDGNLKMALLSLGIGCASGVIRGGGLSIMEKCRIDVGFKYALTFWIVVAVFGMIYLFGMSSPAHAGGAGGFLTNAFENAARHEAPVIVRETLSETFNSKATIEAVSGIDNAASRGTHATTDATSREAIEKSNRDAIERTNQEAAERAEKEAAAKEAQEKAARDEADRVTQQKAANDNFIAQKQVNEAHALKVSQDDAARQAAKVQQDAADAAKKTDDIARWEKTQADNLRFQEQKAANDNFIAQRNAGNQAHFEKTRVNKTEPVKDAVGEHSTWKTNGDGKITKYETWQPNPKNPSGFDSVKRVDTQYGNPHLHVDKTTKQPVPTPHVHEKGGVRPALPWELPK
jgi:hypothetical protein